MRLNMYAIFDRASGVYDRPFQSHSDQSAMRLFVDTCTNKDHFIAQHPMIVTGKQLRNKYLL